MRLNVDILQLQELLMDIGEDPLFQPAVASSGINSAVLSEDILCAAERLLDVMGAAAGRTDPWQSKSSAKFCIMC